MRGTGIREQRAGNRWLRWSLPAAMLAIGSFGQASVAQVAVADAASAAAAPSINFEVVSIRQSKDRNVPRVRSMPRDGDGMTFTNVPMVMVILIACRFNNATLTMGLPDWTLTDRYDVAVKVSSADVEAYHKLTSGQRSMMLRKVLEDRLKLKAHLESRPVLVYDLVVPKNGPKMKLAKPGDTYPDGFKAAPGQTILFTPPSHLVGQGATAAELASRMSDLGDWSIGRQVFDKTGLTGKYDFSLQWTADMKGAGDSDSDGGQGRAEGSGPSLFTAVQEQLGLKLDSAKEPVECLIIDHAERPTEN
jgi:uncharacterized protein (TIGR03435 family)